MEDHSKVLVRKGGLEPPRVLPHQILNLARLPNSATFARCAQSESHSKQ